MAHFPSLGTWPNLSRTGSSILVVACATFGDLGHTGVAHFSSSGWIASSWQGGPQRSELQMLHLVSPPFWGPSKPTWHSILEELEIQIGWHILLLEVSAEIVYDTEWIPANADALVQLSSIGGYDICSSHLGQIG